MKLNNDDGTVDMYSFYNISTPSHSILIFRFRMKIIAEFDTASGESWVYSTDYENIVAEYHKFQQDGGPTNNYKSDLFIVWNITRKCIT